MFGKGTHKRQDNRDTGAWGTGIGRRRPGPDRRAVVGSLAFHVLLFGGLMGYGLLQARNLPQFEVYRVKLVSPPPQIAGVPEPTVAPVVRRPEPQRVVEAPKPRPQPPKRPVETKPPPKEQPKPKPPEPAKGAAPKPDSPGGENLDVDIVGQDFPFPDYLENIILQLNRYFRWSGNPNLQGEVAFYIESAGTIGRGSIRVVEKSGDFNFDLEMMSAVEQAGNRGAFGPLPEGWISDRLWVRFKFLPPG
jgi:hypothetical protein